jgi:DNA-binding IscR family transcriptional regulator
MIGNIGWCAIPNLLQSFRRGSDTRMVDPHTSSQCENNPAEIGYLLKNISEEERENLKNFTSEDLRLTHEDSGIEKLELYKSDADSKKKKGRWGL